MKNWLNFHTSEEKFKSSHRRFNIEVKKNNDVFKSFNQTKDETKYFNVAYTTRAKDWISLSNLATAFACCEQWTLNSSSRDLFSPMMSYICCICSCIIFVRSSSDYKLSHFVCVCASLYVNYWICVRWKVNEWATITTSHQRKIRLPSLSHRFIWIYFFLLLLL